MKRNRCLLFLCVAAILLFSFFCRSTAPQYDYPPLIVIDGVTYKGSGLTMAQLTDDSVYLGTVTSAVPSSKAPVENFQANDKIIGAFVYRIENDVVVYHSDQWWIYCRIE